MSNSYSIEINNPAASVKSCINNAKVSFKNARETSRVLKNKSIPQALAYLKDVIKFKQCVPMKRYARGVGRTAQAKAFGVQRGRWPVNAALMFMDLLSNMAANGKKKGIESDELLVSHVQVNKAPKQYGRLHRAHGRVNAYNRSPCHVEMVAVKKSSKIVGEVERAKSINE